MTELSLIDELRGLGAISERLVAAVLPLPEHELATQSEAVRGKMAEEWEAREAVRINVRELEERLKTELRGVMLLGEHEEYDPTKRDDDEITSALRQCQRLLAAQIDLNEQRKIRLAERAKHRLAYAEYQSALEGVEKSIEAGWAKRVKKHGLKKGGSAATAARPPVPEQLKRLVGVRKGWMESVGARMRERPVGEVRGLPRASIYGGIGEDGGDDGDGADDGNGGNGGDGGEGQGEREGGARAAPGGESREKTGDAKADAAADANAEADADADADAEGERNGEQERRDEEEVRAALGMEVD